MAINEEPKDAPPPQSITGGAGIPSQAEVFGPTVYKSYTYFAEEWFDDAVRESQKPTGDHNARRREIVFAVCFAESYLYEWVHDEVLPKGDYGKLLVKMGNLFPLNQHSSIVERWKKVTKDLRDDVDLPSIGDAPDFNKVYWEEFRKLVHWRNGLVHGGSSRPETSTTPTKERPAPSKDDLDGLQAGWATGVVVELVEQLHNTVGTSPPPYLKIT